MKINPQPLPVFQHAEHLEQHQQPSDFDRWLLKPKRSGDDYYWQHQDQLQQSALRFDAVIKPIDTSVTKDNPSCLLTIKTTEITESDTVKISGLPGMTPSAAAKTIQSLPDFKALHSIINQWLKEGREDLANPAPSTLHRETRATQPVLTSEPRSLSGTPSPEFKNHQLFQNNQTVELAFNALALNPAEIHNLKKMIKTWIARQGLVLDQLLINGVQQ